MNSHKENPKDGDLQVWWIPNPPQEPFVRSVSSLQEAALILGILTDYDLYLGDVIEANAGGLVKWSEEDQEWNDWDDAEYCDFDEWIEANATGDYES